MKWMEGKTCVHYGTYHASMRVIRALDTFFGFVLHERGVQTFISIWGVGVVSSPFCCSDGHISLRSHRRRASDQGVLQGHLPGKNLTNRVGKAQ